MFSPALRFGESFKLRYQRENTEPVGRLRKNIPKDEVQQLDEFVSVNDALKELLRSERKTETDTAYIVEAADRDYYSVFALSNGPNHQTLELQKSLWQAAKVRPSVEEARELLSREGEIVAAGGQHDLLIQYRVTGINELNYPTVELLNKDEILSLFPPS